MVYCFLFIYPHQLKDVVFATFIAQNKEQYCKYLYPVFSFINLWCLKNIPLPISGSIIQMNNIMPCQSTLNLHLSIMLWRHKFMAWKFWWKYRITTHIFTCVLDDTTSTSYKEKNMQKSPKFSNQMEVQIKPFHVMNNKFQKEYKLLDRIKHL